VRAIFNNMSCSWGSHGTTIFGVDAGCGSLQLFACLMKMPRAGIWFQAARRGCPGSHNAGPRRLADRPDRGTAVMPVTGVQLGRPFGKRRPLAFRMPTSNRRSSCVDSAESLVKRRTFGREIRRPLMFSEDSSKAVISSCVRCIRHLHHPNQVCIAADVPTLVERLLVGLPECVKLCITERRFRVFAPLRRGFSLALDLAARARYAANRPPRFQLPSMALVLAGAQVAAQIERYGCTGPASSPIGRAT
jgi:hypothetical protein